MMNDVLGWAITILLAVIAIFLYRLPYVWQDKMLENLKNKNSSQLQRESFFRQTSNNDQQDLLDRWTKRITYMDKAVDSDDFIDLVHKTILYGSDNTVDILSSFDQYMYKNILEEDQNPSQTQSNMYTSYMACIIVSLKEDFSGYVVNPLNIIRIKMKDFDENKDSYKNCILEIKKDVNKISR
ncbi:hypothetical protein OXT66_05730 [Lentilactobacillus senioris]|uniref:hypothetical protein n=1 Tax=Lentilactobacillus senioris TaxID=931534 RepID=UPI00227DB8F4|nr:hypothetical protein [Lentilactobacillus senioris]MCY9807050.1 hypothetical protein [Lentilactobacillus senioris]